MYGYFDRNVGVKKNWWLQVASVLTQKVSIFGHKTKLLLGFDTGILIMMQCDRIHDQGAAFMDCQCSIGQSWCMSLKWLVISAWPKIEIEVKPGAKSCPSYRRNPPYINLLFWLVRLNLIWTSKSVFGTFGFWNISFWNCLRLCYKMYIILI